MNDQEIFDEIKKESEKIDVPNSLSPENMRGRLPERPVSFSAKKKTGVMKYLITFAAAAAAFAIVMVAVGPQLYGKNGADNGRKTNNMVAKEKTFVRSDAGSAYRLAKNDADIKAYVKKLNESSREQLKYTENVAIAENDAAAPIATGIAASDTNTGSYSGTNSHSDTNLIEEGVDESDIVKCDGSYIYRVAGEKVHIVNVENNAMKEISVIEPHDGNRDIYIRDIYLTKDMLIILADAYEEAELAEMENGRSNVYSSRYYWNTKQMSQAYFYDIKDKSAPSLISKYEQDGYYITSRLTDGKLIIFSNDSAIFRITMPYIVNDDMDINYAETKDFDYPMAGDEVLTPGDIYIPEEPGSNSFIMGSVSVNEPGKKIDSCMIMSAGNAPYVTKDSIYLWNTDWDYNTGRTSTDIAKFTYEDGYFNAAASCRVNGSIMDEFAIHEENNNLFVLTSGLNFGISDSGSNTLTVFDSALNKISSLSGIAENEQVYAARYIDNIIYFITYRNMDPLFAVDVSDPKDPKMLGSLEITGFSDYLHPWGNGRLLGIGYETDPKDGRMLGTKLLMFDITDPTKPVILGEKVINDCFPNDLSHKAIMIDRDENLFGFSLFPQDSGSRLSFNTYTWNEGTKSFELKTKIEDFSDMYSGEIRGLRIGDTIYATFETGIADSNGQVLSF